MACTWQISTEWMTTIGQTLCLSDDCAKDIIYLVFPSISFLYPRSFTISSFSAIYLESSVHSTVCPMSILCYTRSSANSIYLVRRRWQTQKMTRDFGTLRHIELWWSTRNTEHANRTFRSSRYSVFRLFYRVRLCDILLNHLQFDIDQMRRHKEKYNLTRESPTIETKRVWERWLERERNCIVVYFIYSTVSSDVIVVVGVLQPQNDSSTSGLLTNWNTAKNTRNISAKASQTKWGRKEICFVFLSIDFGAHSHRGTARHEHQLWMDKTATQRRRKSIKKWLEVVCAAPSSFSCGTKNFPLRLKGSWNKSPNGNRKKSRKYETTWQSYEYTDIPICIFAVAVNINWMSCSDPWKLFSIWVEWKTSGFSLSCIVRFKSLRSVMM